MVQHERLALWKEGIPYPAQADMQYPAGMKHILAHDGRHDILPFLHDVAITAYDGRLYIAWYNSTDAEICGSSLIRGRSSADGGASWSDPFTIVGRIDSSEEHYVPVNLFPHQGKLYATITEMTGKNMTHALHLFEKGQGDAWRYVSRIGDGFISNTAPVRMDNGRYIAPAWMPMKETTPAFPAVLISQGDDIAARWEPRLLYDPINRKSPRIRCAETTVRVGGAEALVFVRNDEGPSYVFRSEDYGQTWSKPYHYTMSVGNAKIFAGALSDGRRYLIYNEDRGYFVRSLLVIAVTEAGGHEYSKVYKLFEDVDEEIGRGSKWFYPCACEDGGHLYVACTLQEPEDFRSAVLAKIPIGSL